MQRKRSQNLERIIDMKHYTVEITNEALADMERLYNHIAYVLQSPENAMDQKIDRLGSMAEELHVAKGHLRNAFLEAEKTIKEAEN